MSTDSFKLSCDSLTRAAGERAVIDERVRGLWRVEIELARPGSLVRRFDNKFVNDSAAPSLYRL